MLKRIILNGLYYSGAQKVLGHFTGGMGAILMLHRVNHHKTTDFSPNSHLTVSPEFLDRLILSCKKAGYEFVSMDEVHERISNPQAYVKSKKFLCFTLDDGYKDNAEYAVPIFKRHSVPYLIYIAPGLVEATSSLWWEDLEQVFSKRNHVYMDMPDSRIECDLSTSKNKRENFAKLVKELLFDLPEDQQRWVVSELSKNYQFDQKSYTLNQIMDWSELNELSKDPLCTLGAHTINHYALAKLSEKEMQYEILQSKNILKSELGFSPKHFAYPYGHKQLAGQREFDYAKKTGFSTAVTTRHGVIYPQHKDHLTALPRVSLNGTFQSVANTKSLLSGIPCLLMNKGKRLNVG